MGLETRKFIKLPCLAAMPKVTHDGDRLEVVQRQLLGVWAEALAVLRPLYPCFKRFNHPSLMTPCQRKGNK